MHKNNLITLLWSEWEFNSRSFDYEATTKLHWQKGFQYKNFPFSTYYYGPEETLSEYVHPITKESRYKSLLGFDPIYNLVWSQVF